MEMFINEIVTIKNNVANGEFAHHDQILVFHNVFSLNSSTWKRLNHYRIQTTSYAAVADVS